MAWERIIFFDLETTSLHRVGQILNFCFVCVDRSWNELARLKGEIKVSRLELPDPLAIVSTGIDIIALNERATYSEREAMMEIQHFFDTWNIPKKTALSGYNIERFDVPFLRTSMLRSGVFPYAHPQSNDLLLLVRHLLGTQDELRADYQEFLVDQQADSVPRISATLEKVSKYFGLLTNAQAHESEDDVELTIALARLIEQKFRISIFDFSGYRLEALHHITKRPVLLSRFSGDFAEPWKSSPYVFLRLEGKASYWIDLEKYKSLPLEYPQKLGSIRRMKFNEDIVRSEENAVLSPEMFSVAADAWATLSSFKVEDLYPEKKCYIENWIYRMDPQGMKDLVKRMNSGPISHDGLSADQRVLLNRFLLANCDELGQISHLVDFEKYVRFRYGIPARMRLDEDRDNDTTETPSRFHATFEELIARFALASDIARKDQNRDGKEHALHQLKVFYRSSPITAIVNGSVPV